MLLHLQRTIGNQAVQRIFHARAEDLDLQSRATAIPSVGHDFSQTSVPERAPAELQTWTTVERYPFRATIRRGPRAPVADQAQATQSRSDAAPGAEHGAEEHRTLLEQLSAIPAAAATPESGFAIAPEGPAPGTTSDEASAGEPAAAPGTTSSEPSSGEPAAATINVPDIEIPALAEIERTDAVRGGFTYSGSIARGGAPPSGYGITRSFNSRLTGVTITPGSGTFEVTATFEHPITYQIRSGTGPDGEVDIASQTDADITRANYSTVASDLTPNMSDLNGRPPRTRFWAEDLTARHERVHANDDRSNGPGAMATVTTWLNGQTAANDGGVRTLLGALPARFATALLAALSTEAGERNAYGDGAPSYRARANAIKAKGDRGEYT